MQFHQLEQFCAVARIEHMSQAADALHISQPTLSLNIAKLEEELGVQLFDRIGRNIKLNKYGRTFLFHIERVLDELETAKQSVLRLDSRQDAQIHVADAILNNTYNIVSAYLDENPSAHVTHQTATLPEIVSMLRGGHIDFAIAAIGNECDFGMDIRWLPVIHCRLMLLVPKSHPFAKRGEVSLNELAGEPLMHAIPDFDSRNCFDRYCERAGFAPNYVYTSIKPFLFNELTRNRGYLSIIPEELWATREHAASTERSSYMCVDDIVGVQITNPICSVDYGILTSKKHCLSNEADAFRDYVSRFFQTRLGDL